jgi:hypothetical protein
MTPLNDRDCSQSMPSGGPDIAASSAFMVKLNMPKGRGIEVWLGEVCLDAIWRDTVSCDDIGHEKMWCDEMRWYGKCDRWYQYYREYHGVTSCNKRYVTTNVIKQIKTYVGKGSITNKGEI